VNQLKCYARNALKNSFTIIYLGKRGKNQFKLTMNTKIGYVFNISFSLINFKINSRLAPSTDTPMLENIFIANHTSDKTMLQMTMAYPDESILLNNDPLVKQILASQQITLEQDHPPSTFTEDFLHIHCKALRVNGSNLLILPLPFRYLLGFLFDPDCNPYDYRNEIIRLVQEYVLKVFHTRPDLNYLPT